MKVHGDLKPREPFSLEPVPNKPGCVLARFYENIDPYTETVDGVEVSGYVYDEYCLILLGTATVAEEIKSQYAAYLEQARLNEIRQIPFDSLDYHKRREEINELSELMVDQVYSLTLMELGLWGGEDDAV